MNIKVVIVRYKSECDVEPVPGLIPMSYDQAIETLRMMNRAKPRQLDNLDIVSVQEDGSLGRFVSWLI